jgi:hypothetical protein
MPTLLEEIKLKCSPAMLANRDDGAIAALVSVGRTVQKSTMITERGVRAIMSATDASPFLRLLRDASLAVGVPTWLTTSLTAAGVPLAKHEDYSDTIKSAWHWLQEGAGIDIGNPTATAMLDIIAFTDPPKYTVAVNTLKALAIHNNPASVADVQKALEGYVP